MKTIIFTLSPSCCGSVVKRNVNQITLISKDIAITVKTLRKIKLQTAFYSLQVYKTGTFPTHFFLGFFRVTVFLSKCFEKFLKDLTAKRLYQRPGKHLKIRHLHVPHKLKVWEKKLKSLKKGANVGILLQQHHHMTLIIRASTTDVL